MPWTNSERRRRAAGDRPRSRGGGSPPEAREILARKQPPQRMDDLRAGGHQHVGEFDRLLHRRLDPIEAELGRRLLGVVDDVVERRRKRVAVAGVNGARTRRAAVQPVDDVVRDPVALALARAEILSQRRMLGKLGEKLSQQERRALDVAARLFDKRARAGSVDRVGSLIRGRVGISTSSASFASRLLHASITSSQRQSAARRDPMGRCPRQPKARTRFTPANWRSGSARAWCSRPVAR